uniref:Uncharacterized protein n=1 Tax=Rhizophora mucronata TaxID=61149 RepID=A0A2P2JGN0_RHIMU
MVRFACASFCSFSYCHTWRRWYDFSVSLTTHFCLSLLFQIPLSPCM